MSKLEVVKNQIRDLKLEESRLIQCQQKIGEHVFNLYEDGLIQDEWLRAEISKIISGVNVNEYDLFDLAL